jgi:glutamine synthetase
MTPKRRRELGIKQLPATLREAYEELESDRAFLKPIFGDDVIERIIEHEVKEQKRLQ